MKRVIPEPPKDQGEDNIAYNNDHSSNKAGTNLENMQIQEEIDKPQPSKLFMPIFGLIMVGGLVFFFTTVAMLLTA